MSESNALVGWSRSSRQVWHATRIIFRVARIPWINLAAVDGREHLPDGPCILAANHSSNFDAPVFGYNLDGRYVAFFAKESLFRGPLGWWHRQVRAIPVDKTGRDPRSLERAIRRGKRVLEVGHTVAIFPEGTRTRTGRLGLGHEGAAALSRASGCPIVPAGIDGTWTTPEWRGRFRRRVTITIGEPFHPRALAPKAEQTQLIMARIAALLPEERWPLPEERADVFGRWLDPRSA